MLISMTVKFYVYTGGKTFCNEAVKSFLEIPTHFNRNCILSIAPVKLQLGGSARGTVYTGEPQINCCVKAVSLTLLTGPKIIMLNRSCGQF